MIFLTANLFSTTGCGQHMAIFLHLLQTSFAFCAVSKFDFYVNSALDSGDPCFPLGAHAKFHNPSCLLSGRKVRTLEKRKKENFW
jgi:hypothetical protein